MVKAIPTRIEDHADHRDRRRPENSPSSHPQASAKLVAARAKRLRQVIIRGVLTGLAMSVALGGFVLWQRDAARANEAMNRIQPFVDRLREEVSRLGAFPLYFPVAKIGKLEVRDVLVYPPPETIVQLRRHSGPVLLAHGVRGPRLYLHSSGRPLVMADGNKVSVRWASDSEWSELLKQRNEFVDQRLKSLSENAPNLP